MLKSTIKGEKTGFGSKHFLCKNIRDEPKFSSFVKTLNIKVF